VPLPLDPEELETALDPIRRMVASQVRGRAGIRRSSPIIKSEGGIGALRCWPTGVRFALANWPPAEACLIDLDVQFGNAALQLGFSRADFR
jgi:pilus assembly protein CpaE